MPVKKRNWLQVSLNARHTMQLMGDLTPTMFPKDRCLFSRAHNRTLHVSYLRKMAEHIHEVADWLDKTADQHAEPVNFNELLKRITLFTGFNFHERN